MKINYQKSKKITFFLLFLFTQCFCFAQNLANITIKDKNITLKKALELVEKQSKLSIAYNQSQLNVSKTININVVNESLDDVLKTILKNTGFTYKIDGSYIIITPNDNKKAVQTQKSTKRSGKVINQNGEPIIGANILVKGTSIGTISDINGNFDIEVSDNSTLAISFIGHVPAQVHVQKKRELKVVLTEDMQKLDEVVVVGYNSVKKGQMTGSLKIVNGKELDYQSSPTLENRLQGKVAGVMILSGSGQPGSDNLQVRVRGTGSINGSNTPLYIMDGVMVEPGDFASLNPNDIADIQVLKDATATAIYGSRGANGVIVILTKSGVSGKTKFNYKNQFGYSIATEYLDMMDSKQNIQYQLQCVQSDPGRGDFPLMQTLKREADGTATAGDLTRLARARAVDTDWINELTRTGFLTEHSLSASGGTEKTKFYLSGSYLKQDGILKKSSMDRISGRFNIDHTANKYLSFGLKMSAGYSTVNFADPKGVNSRNSWANPWFTALLAYPYESPSEWYNKDNPTLITKYFEQRENKLKAVWSTYLKVNATDWLSFKTNYGMDFMYNRGEDVLHRNHPNSAGNKGSFKEDASELARYTWTNTANIAKDFNNGHSLSAVIGMEMFEGKYYGFNFTGYDINPDMMDTPAGIGDKIGASKNPPRIGGGKTMSNLMSYFTQVGYTINKKYNLSGSLRHDTSSKFTGKNKSALFWSVGGSWNMNSEDFLKNVSWLNSLKLRASYGTTGNQDGVSDFGTFDGYSNTSYGGNAGYVHSQIGNSSLRWETSAQTNVGIDFSILSQRLSGTVDMYYIKTKDLYMSKKISSTSGFGSILTNAGSIANKGIEISLNGGIIRSKDFNWDLGINFTYNKNEILDLGTWSNNEGKFQDGDVLYQIGKPLGTWSMVEWAGVNPDNGIVMFYDANRNKTENIADAPKFTNFGSSEIPFFGGFNTTINYKEFTLSADFNYAFNYKVMNGARWYLYNHHFNGNKPAKMLDMWMKPGDITDIPRFGAGSQPSPWASQFLEDASYLRLKNIRLNYSLPKNLLKKTKFFESISFYAQAENVFTWTKYQGADPEVNGSLDMLSYPKPRNFTFGFDFNF